MKMGASTLCLNSPDETMNGIVGKNLQNCYSPL